MTELTAKQKENRAYHARHAEAIRAKKREQYQAGKADGSGKPAKKKAAKPHPLSIKKTKDKRVKIITVSEEDRQKTETRRNIEDILLARELEIDRF